jgi:hypothetical protein
MKQIHLYAIVAGIGAVVIIAGLGIVFSRQSLLSEDQQMPPGWTAPDAAPGNGILPPPPPPHPTPPMPYSVLLNGKNDTSVRVTIPQGESRIVNVSVTPRIVGINGAVEVHGLLPQCSDVQGTHARCLDENITATLSQVTLPTSKADLAPIPILMNITVPKDAAVGIHGFKVDVRTNYTWPDGYVTHLGVDGAIGIQVVSAGGKS